MPDDERLAKAREELSRLDAQTRALADRLAAGENDARAELNAAIRRSNEARAMVRQLENEDRRARGLPDPPMPMYGPPPARQRLSEATESGTTGNKRPGRGILGRLFRRK